MAEMTGVAYDAVKFQELEGQPFGVGVGYNGMIFGNLENIVDLEGPVAVRGDALSYRGMSVGFGRMGKQTIPFSAKDVRFLAGGNVTINGTLTVVGNVLTAGNGFQASAGSTYLVGSDGSANQRQTLASLYAANGSPYWEPAEQNGHFVISCYDVPRSIPASRVGADVPAFFAAARASFDRWKAALASMAANGTTAQGGYGYVFTGTNAAQNVFDLTWPQEESIIGNLTFQTPSGSLNIVRIHSGETMNVSTPLWGAEPLASRTLYVLMDARTVRLNFPSAIYGSVLAPDAQWNALTTGGNINGNAALGGLWVQEGSGFELHWYPFAGGVTTGGGANTGCPACPAECPPCPLPEPCAACKECPACPNCAEGDGVISGCIFPCGQCTWRVKLCDAANRQTLSVWCGCGMECFRFEANASGAYALDVEACCHYELRLGNVGVRALSICG
ncbi:MAG: choice-of-anchor A family protein [Clostridia bacterium]